MREKDSGFTRGLRFSDLDEGMHLWELYVAESRRHVEALGARAFEMRYEDFLANPLPHLVELTAFLGLEADDEVLKRSVADVDASRAFPFMSRTGLVELAERHSTLLGRYGYGPEGRR